MPKHLSLKTVVEKNRIASPEPFIMLLEVEVTSRVTGTHVETLYLAHNNEDITYQGNVYQKANFDFSITESAEEIPEVKLNISDPTGSVIEKAEEHAGGVGWKVKMRYVTTANLDQPPEIEELVYVIGSKATAYTCEFTLGARNPLTSRFPRRLQWRNRCSFRYKGEECGYTGAMPSCDFTLNGPNGCKAHNNATRFGALPGIKRR